MTTKEKIKHLIDQLPDQDIDFIEPLLVTFLQRNKRPLPMANLGLKKSFDRKNLYDEFLADRY